MSIRLSIVLLILVALVTVGLWQLAPKADNPGDLKPRLTEAMAPELAELVAQLWAQTETDPGTLAVTLADSHSPVYLAARSRGRRIARHWQSSGNSLQNLQAALEHLQRKLPATVPSRRIDTLELLFAYDFQTVKNRKSGWLGNIHRGVRGLEVRHGAIQERYAPTWMLETNRSADKLLQLFLARHKLKPQSLWRDAEISSFAADQWLVTLRPRAGGQATARLMQRGNTVVLPEQVTAETVQNLGRLATHWLRNNLQPDGRMTYKYWPSVRKESAGNNMIRQWMATVAMVRAAKHWQDDALMKAAAANIDYNLSRFYRLENDFGLIEFNMKVKLGAVALAALAIAEHPQRQRWASQETALQRTMDYLWQDNGAFNTFYKPAGRNDVQNFYPGEALLYWATLYEESRDAALLKRIMASFHYYRDWHLIPKNRNPAFIPWHSQAYFKVWKITADEALSRFVFDMNDWLVEEMQAAGRKERYPDTAGRFYNASKPYGPPHVSSTGVYMEGLIDAFRIAVSLGDQQRAERYRQSIVRGLRSVMQLQFVDEVDMYYVPLSLRQRVQGGIRTTVYNNEIRCDNVQHNLMAVLKILPVFSTGDYQLPP